MLIFIRNKAEKVIFENYPLLIIHFKCNPPIFAAQKIDLNGKSRSNQKRCKTEYQAQRT